MYGLACPSQRDLTGYVLCLVGGHLDICIVCSKWYIGMFTHVELGERSLPFVVLAFNGDRYHCLMPGGYHHLSLNSPMCYPMVLYSCDTFDYIYADSLVMCAGHRHSPFCQ